MPKATGRPRIDDEDKLAVFLPRVRCSKTELDAVKQRAAQSGLTASDYTRQMLLSGAVVMREAAADFALTDQLRRIGVNLNQVARVANATGEIDPVKLDDCLATLNDLLEKLIHGA